MTPCDRYVTRFAMLAVIGLMAVGNSAFHTPWIAVPFSMAAIIGFGSIIVTQYAPSPVPIRRGSHTT